MWLIVWASLQEDWNNPKKWLDTSLLTFHPDQWNVLRLEYRTEEAYEYKLDQNPLKQTQSEKSLGIVIDNRQNFQSMWMKKWIKPIETLTSSLSLD